MMSHIWFWSNTSLYDLFLIPEWYEVLIVYFAKSTALGQSSLRDVLLLIINQTRIFSRNFRFVLSSPPCDWEWKGRPWTIRQEGQICNISIMTSSTSICSEIIVRVSSPSPVNSLPLSVCRILGSPSVVRIFSSASATVVLRLFRSSRNSTKFVKCSWITGGYLYPSNTTAWKSARSAWHLSSYAFDNIGQCPACWCRLTSRISTHVGQGSVNSSRIRADMVFSWLSFKRLCKVLSFPWLTAECAAWIYSKAVS